MRLQQVVSNLLTNAIKFSPSAGRSSVTLDAKGGQARLQVTDNGTGIDPAFLPQVFNRFAQEDTSSTRSTGGLGLGLAIVRHLVEQHHGTVEARSPGIGQGATFTVTLPLAATSEEAVDEDDSPVVPRKPSSGVSDVSPMEDLPVLVVDDDLGAREVVAEMLTGMGARVRVAATSAEAMTAIHEQRPNVLVCDIAMPGEDGYAFIRKLRAMERDGRRPTPAIALTALAGEADAQRSLEAGFQMHLTKPIDMRRLSEAVLALARRADMGSISGQPKYD